MPLCMGCLNEIESKSIKCANCGFDNSVPQSSPFLPYGTVLKGKYVVAKDLGTNGESTRYLAYDKTTGKVVNIREFLPIGLFEREQGSKLVFVAPEFETKYSVAISDFENYYSKLKSLSDMTAIIPVYEVFRENNTCYVVEDNCDYVSFIEYVKKNGGHLDWETARPLLMPIISLLEALNKEEIGHYAISPNNLYVNEEGKLVLTGFATENERKRGTMLKSQLFSGCAAPEQYRNNSELDVATDVYGFTATLFFALTGNLPANAKERMKDSRLLISTNTVKRLPPHVVTALANGLQVKKELRISDFDELRSQLSVASTVQAIQDEISRTASMTPIKDDVSKKSTVSPFAIGIVATVVAILVFSAIGFYWLSSNPFGGFFEEPTQAATVAVPTEEWTGPVVDNYVGKSYKDVEARVQSDSSLVLKVAADGEYSDTVPEGCVISQVPAAGEPIKGESSMIYLVLSKGPEMKKLPDVTDKTLDDASKELLDLGFIVIQEAEYSGTYEDGVVMGYANHKAGDTVESGSEITLKVSKGQELPDETESE